MAYTKETEDGKTVMRLHASLTIYDAPALHEAFVDCFENGGDMTIDIGEVTECDAAGLQLLCAARRNARESRQAFRITGASEAVVDALQRLGLNADEIV